MAKAKDPKRVAAGKKAYQTRLKNNPDKVREFHARGGEATGGQFDKDQELAKRAGSKGGKISRRSIPTEHTVNMGDGAEVPFMVEEGSENVKQV